MLSYCTTCCPEALERPVIFTRNFLLFFFCVCSLSVKCITVIGGQWGPVIPTLSRIGSPGPACKTCSALWSPVAEATCFDHSKPVLIQGWRRGYVHPLFCKMYTFTYVQLVLLHLVHLPLINPFSAGLFLSYNAESNFPKWFLTFTWSPSGGQFKQFCFWSHSICKLVLEQEYRWRHHSDTILQCFRSVLAVWADPI
jgi:hypothetical protein